MIKKVLLTKKQKLLNKKLRKHKSKSFIKKQERKEYKKALKEWALKIRARDKACVICGSKENLNAHHLISKTIKELALDENNGVLVCAKHHLFCKKISAHKGSLLFVLIVFETRREQILELLKNIKNDFFKSMYADKVDYDTLVKLGDNSDYEVFNELSLCKKCYVMTKTVLEKDFFVCGKCKEPKPEVESIRTMEGIIYK